MYRLYRPEGSGALRCCSSGFKRLFVIKHCVFFNPYTEKVVNLIVSAYGSQYRLTLNILALANDSP